jgi:hypothetical protein
MEKQPHWIGQVVLAAFCALAIFLTFEMLLRWAGML